MHPSACLPLVSCLLPLNLGSFAYSLAAHGRFSSLLFRGWSSQVFRKLKESPLKSHADIFKVEVPPLQVSWPHRLVGYCFFFFFFHPNHYLRTSSSLSPSNS